MSTRQCLGVIIKSLPLHVIAVGEVGAKRNTKTSSDSTEVSFAPSCIFELGCYRHGQNLSTNAKTQDCIKNF